MHYLYFVKLNKEIKNKEEAIKEAVSHLDNNNFASSENGFFVVTKADWYVVGGRWSGEFSRILTPKEKIRQGNKAILPLIPKKLQKEKDILDYLYINEMKLGENKEVLMKKVDDEYKKVTGFVYFRDTYKAFGYEDDAIKITSELIKKLKSKYYKKVEIFDADNYQEIKCKDLTKDNIGEWLVVIDYHI